jgi:pseudouridine-5'-phosphate glycosidase
MFPGFFTRKTKHKAPFHSDSLDKIAKILKINSDLGLKNGTLIACPISEEFDQESDRIEQAIQKALIEAE